MTAVGTEDKRSALRHRVRFRASAHLLDQEVPLEADNLSRDGLYFRSPHAPPVGHALHVSLRLDGVHALEAVATVVRVDAGRGFAARLSVPGREGRAQWARYLATLHDDDAADPPWQRTVDPQEVFDFQWVNQPGDEHEASPARRRD
jgi:hypothetical protein